MDAPSEIQRVRLNSRGAKNLCPGWPGELINLMKIILQLMRSFLLYIYLDPPRVAVFLPFGE